mgnify:CR=1 FL=1
MKKTILIMPEDFRVGDKRTATHGREGSSGFFMEERKMEKKKAIVKKEGVDVIDNLKQATWKLQGIAGLFFSQDSGRTVLLDESQSAGLYFLLNQIADEIKTNAELIEEVAA